jgi:alcohol dehydrogenase
LTISQPAIVTATAGFDAIAHAVETYVTAKRNPMSDIFSREAWRLLEANYERVLANPADLEARGAMQLGAYFAGVAIETSMLGATHACANPLTAHYGTTHGLAIAVMLPHVVRWNKDTCADRYLELLQVSNRSHSDGHPGISLATRLEELARAGGLPANLRAVEIPKSDLSMLAQEAAGQWTGRYNPRPFDAAGALEVYEWAY